MPDNKKSNESRFRVTYLSFRGMGGHENIYPEQVVLKSSFGLTAFGKDVMITGLFPTHKTVEHWVPPSAIIEIAEVV